MRAVPARARARNAPRTAPPTAAGRPAASTNTASTNTASNAAIATMRGAPPRRGLMSVERGAVVLAAVGIGFAVLAGAVVVAAPVHTYEALAPLLIGPALKAVLAFGGAAVCLQAGRMLRRMA